MNEKKHVTVWRARPGATPEETIASALEAYDQLAADGLRRSATTLLHQRADIDVVEEILEEQRVASAAQRVHFEKLLLEQLGKTAEPLSLRTV